MKKTYITVPIVVVLALSILLGQLSFSSAIEGPIPGAIFTTDETGLLVNGNIYADASDVYLSGGPGPNAPPTAAGLPDGQYYFQVTDPSGKKLLSTDSVEERKFLVEGGVITQYLGTTHIWNVVMEIPAAIVIQLLPFGNTPNKGGVYKAWATPVDRYDPNDPHSFFGFIPRYSKTDNYKVRKIRPITTLTLDKFYDANNNGEYDNDDYLIQSWTIWVKDPLGVTNTYHTPRVIDVTGLPGIYTVTEDLPAGWIQTAVAVDGIYIKPPKVTVLVPFANGETHSVFYGNRKARAPPITVSLSIDPFSQYVGGNIIFSWEIISPPEATPIRVELKLSAPDGSTIIFDEGVTLIGSRTWTAQPPTGFWWVYVTYYYEYLGTTRRAGTMGQFEVHTSTPN